MFAAYRTMKSALYATREPIFPHAMLQSSSGVALAVVVQCINLVSKTGALSARQMTDHSRVRFVERSGYQTVIVPRRVLLNMRESLQLRVTVRYVRKRYMPAITLSLMELFGCHWYGARLAAEEACIKNVSKRGRRSVSRMGGPRRV